MHSVDPDQTAPDMSIWKLGIIIYLLTSKTD